MTLNVYSDLPVNFLILATNEKLLMTSPVCRWQTWLTEEIFMTKYCQQKPLFVTNIISEVWVTKEMLVYITNTGTRLDFVKFGGWYF